MTDPLSEWRPQSQSRSSVFDSNPPSRSVSRASASSAVTYPRLLDHLGPSRCSNASAISSRLSNFTIRSESHTEETCDYIPIANFSIEDQELEKEKLYAVVRSVAAGNRKIDEIYLNLAQSFGSLDKEKLFTSAAKLQEFIVMRSHVFHYSIISGKVTNRGFGYMAGIAKIARDVSKMVANDGACELQTILDHTVHKFRKFTPFTNTIERMEDDEVFDRHENTLKGLYRHLDENHKQLFKLSENGEIALRDATLTIPSIWHPCCLPTLPDTIYRDQSRTFNFVAYVIVAQPRYLKLRVIVGKYNNGSIYVTPKEIGMDDVNLGDMFPSGSIVSVCAFLTFNAANHFTATNVIGEYGTKISMREKIDTNDELVKTISLISDNTSVDRKSAFVDPVQKRSDQDFAQKAIDMEVARIKYMDSLFGNGTLSPEDVEQRFFDLQETGNVPFTLVSELGEFITNRPHLYFIDEANGVARCTKSSEREMARSFFDFMSKQRYGMSMKNMTVSLKGGEAGTQLQMLLVTDGLEGWLRRHEPLICKISIEPDCVYLLRGAYSTYEKVFVPNVPQAFFD